MIGRDGRNIVVGYSTVELLYLEAANSLPPTERSNAIIDISEMCGRDPGLVRDKANQMRRDKIQADWERSRSILVANKRAPGLAQPLTPSDFKWPSRARLMAGR